MEIKCPACHAYLDDDDEDLNVGEIIYCSKCYQDFEVTKTRPVRLKPIKAWSPEENIEENLDEGYEEDYDDSDDDGYYE